MIDLLIRMIVFGCAAAIIALLFCIAYAFGELSSAAEIKNMYGEFEIAD